MPDFFDQLNSLALGSRAQRATERLKNLNDSAPKAPKPLPQIRGKVIGETLYLRAEDVLAALTSGGQGDSPFAKKLQQRLGDR